MLTDSLLLPHIVFHSQAWLSLKVGSLNDLQGIFNKSYQAGISGSIKYLPAKKLGAASSNLYSRYVASQIGSLQKAILQRNFHIKELSNFLQTNVNLDFYALFTHGKK